MELIKNASLEKCSEFVQLLEKFDFSVVRDVSKSVKQLLALASKEDSDSTIFCYAKLIEKMPDYENVLGDDFASSECEPRLRLELLKKIRLDEMLFDEMVE